MSENATNAGSASPVRPETWRLDHPERGLIEVHIGPDVLLRELDAGFPVTEPTRSAREDAGAGDEAAETGDAAETTGDAEATATGGDSDGHRRRWRGLDLDDVPRRVLITVDGTVYARLKNLGNARVSLKPKAAENLGDRKFTEPAPTLEAPMLKLDSNVLDSWMRTIVYKEDGRPGIELDPPEGSRAAQRYAAMASSPWKRVVYPLSAGLGKGGGALAAIVLVPIVVGFLRPVLDWLGSLLPDFDIDIPWPDFDIPWPDIDIPWPDWSLPDVTAPDWVLFLLEYSKVWIPVLIGLGLGVMAVRRYRTSQQTKREWQQGRGEHRGDRGADSTENRDSDTP